ncbi:MAG: hypothetical protein ACRDRJ_06475, partial [Streptosporangiaceae bacterium]
MQSRGITPGPPDRGARSPGPPLPSARAGQPTVTDGTRGASSAVLLRALDTVRDPELDEPITALGFVAGCDITAG